MTNKIYKFIDLVFILSLLSIVPFVLYKFPFLISSILSLSIILGTIFWLNWQKKTDFKEKETKIKAAVTEFIATYNYDKFKMVLYTYPVPTLYILSTLLPYESILTLNFSSLNHREFKPDQETIKNLLTYFEGKHFSIEELDSPEFLGEFIHYNLNLKS